MVLSATADAGALRSPSSASRAAFESRHTACAGISALVLLAPFEAIEPLVRLPGQVLSSVETVLLIVLAAWIGSCLWTRSIPQWRTALTWPWLAFIGAMGIAALAGVDRTNGLHMAGRFALAFVVYLLTVNGVTTVAQLRAVLTTAAISAAAIALLVILEYVNNGPVMKALTVFRPGIAVIGSQVRAAGPFQYPTIASMYLEIVFALTLGLLLLAIDADVRHPSRPFKYLIASLIAIALLTSEAVTLTFTRSGLVTMMASVMIVALLRAWLSRFDRGTKVLLALAAFVIFQVLMSRSFESLRLRLTTEGLEAWYQMTVDAPDDLSLRTASRTTVPITLTNAGRSTWDSNAVVPFRLSYHWLLADDDRVVSWENLRTDFPSPVVPGQRVAIQAQVEAPDRPGAYRLMWDIEQVQRLWFSTEPDAEMFVSRAVVTGAPAGRLAPITLIALPRRAVRPGRGVLWRAALRMAAAHPWAGVGPDNYRLLYGTYAGYPNFDRRTHSNNMYLEILVGGGLLGAVAFAWFCWRAGKAFTHPVFRPVDRRLATLTASVLAAGAAIALHGLVDSFLGFTATYTLIAIVIGLAVAGDRLNEADAHRF